MAIILYATNNNLRADNQIQICKTRKIQINKLYNKRLKKYVQQRKSEII